MTSIVPRLALFVGMAGMIACGGNTGRSLSSPSTPSGRPADVAPLTVGGTSPTARGHAARLEGPLSDLAGPCPAVTFTVDGTTVSTMQNTRFSSGTCAQLMNGTTVIVDGVLQNGSVAARDVRIEVPVVHVRGTVSALQGGCPAVTFTIDNTTVSTTQSTRFAGGTCAQLSNGVTVVVDGTLQNASVAANEVLQRR